MHSRRDVAGVDGGEARRRARPEGANAPDHDHRKNDVYSMAIARGAITGHDGARGPGRRLALTCGRRRDRRRRE